jgi:hypothetical protein
MAFGELNRNQGCGEKDVFVSVILFFIGIWHG